MGLIFFLGIRNSVENLPHLGRNLLDTDTFPQATFVMDNNVFGSTYLMCCVECQRQLITDSSDLKGRRRLELESKVAVQLDTGRAQPAHE